MSQPVGNFDCAALLVSKVKIEQIWADAAANTKQFYANVLSLNTIKEKQTAQFTVMTDPEKDYDVKIVWLADCAPDDPINVDEKCDVGGVAIESDCKTYTMTKFAKRKFTIDENTFRTSMYTKEEVLARTMLLRMKQLDEEITLSVVADILAMKGVNQYTGGPATVTGNDTFIPSVNWDANLMGYLTQAMILNRFPSAYLLSGNNLFQQAWQIAMQQTNAQNGAADAKKMAQIQLINDLFAMEASAPKTTLLIDPSAAAFVTKHRNPSTPFTYANGADITLWSQPSKNVPGLIYDVSYKTRCVGDNIYHDYGVTAHFDTFQNPLGCNVDNTGILSFTCQ